MFYFNPIALAYGVMIVGIIFFFVYNRKKTREIRVLCNGFAGEFATLSNFIIKGARNVHLNYRESGGGIKVDENQSGKLKSMMNSALLSESVECYARLLKFAEEIDGRTYRSKTHKQQFGNPIDEIYKITYTFLNGCNDIKTIDTKEKAEAFNSFINDQVKHRMTLLRLISGDYSDEYRKLNSYYLNEMIEEERRRDEEKMKRRH